MANDATLLEKCFSPEQLRFSGTSFEYYVFTVLFPPICFFGIAGNLLSLIVLLSKEMRSRFVVAISVERLIAIRYPLRIHWTQRCVVRLVLGIVVATFILTFYDHYAYVCVTRSVCNGTQIVGRCHDVAQDRYLRKI
uniref:G_PROTEIN_RECEP_F1_2 domain-containing protein n=1 Tax=Syphacia muris TaxID=451379 RepID=A0A0N5AJ32_9BILA